ncbi:MAG: DUF805 domain-containing protein [Pikeienuella sp.]
MTFREALERCFDGAFSFSGRAPRPEFWWFVLFWVMTYQTILIVSALSLPIWLGEFLLAAFSVAMMPPLVAVAFRRLQDTGRTGWLALTPIFGAVVVSGGKLAELGEVVFVGRSMMVGIVLVLLYWLGQPGMRRANAFGPPYRG